LLVLARQVGAVTAGAGQQAATAAQFNMMQMACCRGAFPLENAHFESLRATQGTVCLETSKMLWLTIKIRVPHTAGLTVGCPLDSGSNCPRHLSPHNVNYAGLPGAEYALWG